MIRARVVPLSWALFLALWLAPATCWAQIGISCGTDGGITMTDPHVRFIDPTMQKKNPMGTIALGIDVGGYYLPSKEIAVGFAIAPSFYAAGPEPSFGINFALGPRFVWRPGRLHLAADAAFVASSYEDACQGGFDAAASASCPPTHKSASAAPGFGFGLAPLVRVASLEIADVLVGPAFRYQAARYSFSDTSGSFLLSDFQIVLGVRVFLGMAPPKPPAQ